MKSSLHFGSSLDLLRSVRGGLVIAAVTAALSACSIWGGSSAKPVPADLGPNVALFSVRQAWSGRVGAAPMLPDVHAGGNVATMASSDGVVAAIDARTGVDVWRTALGEPLAAGVGSDGKFAAVVSRSNQLVVLDAGRELWRKPLPAQAFTAPLVAGGRVFVLTADRSVAAFDVMNGRRLWVLPRPGEPLALRQSGVLIAVGDTLVAGLSGRLVGINPDSGTVRWEAPIASPRGTNDVERLVDLVGRTSRAGSSVCTRAFQAAVGCVNAVRGTVSWTQQANGSQGVHGDASSVFGVESNGVVVAWNRSDGSRLWSSDRLKYRKLTAPLLLGRAVVVGDESGLVHLLSRDDASPLNRLMTDGSGIDVAPVVAADTLVVATRSGGVFGFRAD